MIQTLVASCYLEEWPIFRLLKHSSTTPGLGMARTGLSNPPQVRLLRALTMLCLMIPQDTKLFYLVDFPRQTHQVRRMLSMTLGCGMETHGHKSVHQSSQIRGSQVVLFTMLCTAN